MKRFFYMVLCAGLATTMFAQSRFQDALTAVKTHSTDTTRSTVLWGNLFLSDCFLLPDSFWVDFKFRCTPDSTLRILNFRPILPDSVLARLKFTSWDLVNLKTGILTFDDVLPNQAISSTANLDTHTAETAISVFPNPTTGVITVTHPHLFDSKILIFNELGSLIQRLEPDETQTKFDLSFYPKGLYFVKAQDKWLQVVKQ